MTGFPTVLRSALTRLGLRRFSVVALVLGVFLGGTALAVAGTDKKSDEYGEMGPSPVPAAVAVNGATSFRVSSFNILGWDHTEKGGSKAKAGYADGAKRMRWAIQLLKSHQVDVVGLQEFQPQQYDKWVKKASAQYDIFPGYTDTVGFLRNSIAWRKDKFSLVSTSWIKLPYFHGDVLRMPVVLLQSLQTGQQIYFMNFQNPADVRGNAAKWRMIGQRFQIALVNQLKISNGLPVVWTGDMNARQQVFCRVTKQAAMVSASGGYRSETSCQPPRGMVVDWIFGSNVQFSNYVQERSKKVIRTTDHHLLVTDALVQPMQPVIPPPTVTPTVPTTPTTSV
ncbi:endonuclease/exonuclease/phosphatase family protein, partial [uncultured Nocardioides sp.]|uniref:endonuclease/exonuclease/phosphatase family protein n=1 Tax=uncultured Nocardioides sp. TaxID=198441 RepID=UPI00262FDE43